MLFLLLALQAAQPSAPDSVVVAARRAVAPLTDTNTVRAAGFVPLLEIRLLDRTPFQGEHWISQARLLADTTLNIALDEPTFVMMGPVNGRVQRVGVAYITRLRQGTPGPVGLGGDHTAAWHTHQGCNNAPGHSRFILAESAEDCRNRGGTPGPRQIFMVHVWTDVPNPEGVYGHDNPALPFLAIGLKPPGEHDLHDSSRVRTIRALAMALAETYDSRLPPARAIERANADSALADSLRAHRDAIAAKIPALKAADHAGNHAAYERVSRMMIVEWEALQRLYERMAPTPQILAQLQREYRAALTRSHH